MPPKPYALADKAIRQLNKLAVQRFSKQFDFDELNIIQEIRTLYRQLDNDNRKKFIELYTERYKEVREDIVEELLEMELAGLLDIEATKSVDEILSEPNDVTHYAYDAEIPRKRDRLEEAVNSAKGTSGKKAEMKKGLKYWSRMTGWYADIVSDRANVRALKDSGVQRVKWNTQDDEKVCKVCRERDGKIYLIDAIPPKPHPGCRCYVTKDEDC